MSRRLSSRRDSDSSTGSGGGGNGGGGGGGGGGVHSRKRSGGGEEPEKKRKDRDKSPGGGGGGGGSRRSSRSASHDGEDKEKEKDEARKDSGGGTGISPYPGGALPGATVAPLTESTTPGSPRQKAKRRSSKSGNSVSERKHSSRRPSADMLDSLEIDMTPEVVENLLSNYETGHGLVPAQMTGSDVNTEETSSTPPQSLSSSSIALQAAAFLADDDRKGSQPAKNGGAGIVFPSTVPQQSLGAAGRKANTLSVMTTSVISPKTKPSPKKGKAVDPQELSGGSSKRRQKKSRPRGESRETGQNAGPSSRAPLGDYFPASRRSSNDDGRSSTSGDSTLAAQATSSGKKAATLTNPEPNVKMSAIEKITRKSRSLTVKKPRQKPSETLRKDSTGDSISRGEETLPLKSAGEPGPSPRATIPKSPQGIRESSLNDSQMLSIGRRDSSPSGLSQFLARYVPPEVNDVEDSDDDSEDYLSMVISWITGRAPHVPDVQPLDIPGVKIELQRVRSKPQGSGPKIWVAFLLLALTSIAKIVIIALNIALLALQYFETTSTKVLSAILLAVFCLSVITYIFNFDAIVKAKTRTIFFVRALSLSFSHCLLNFFHLPTRIRSC